MASKQLLCDGDYTAVRVDDYVAQLEHIYLILQPEKSNGIQVGRHVRFDFKLGTNKIESVTPSTKSCLLIPPEVSSSEAVFVTHLLSETPTDFHEYLNLFHEKTILVSTTSGLWRLEDGKIFKFE